MLIFACSLSLSAQKNDRGHKHRHFDVEKHHQERADFITKELNLTEAEKKAFIPLMEEYIHARFELNREMRNAIRELRKKEVKTADDYQMLIDKDLELKQKEVELQKKYYAKFREVLSAEKVFKYGFAEKKFTQNVVKNFHKQQKDKK